MRKNQHRKISLIIVLLFAIFVNAQNSCVIRDHRYLEAPSIVTIYNGTHISSTIDSCNVEYTISILVDSIYVSEKVYRLTCWFGQHVKNPLFELELVEGEKFVVFPTIISRDGLYFEAILDEEEVRLFRKKQVYGITVWHKDLEASHNSKIECEPYFTAFMDKY